MSPENGAGGRRGSVAGLAWAKYLPAPLGLITGPLVARALGPVGRGEVAAVTVFGLVLPVAVSLGVPLAIGREAAVHPEHRGALLGSARRFAVYVTPICWLLAWATLEGPLGGMRGWSRPVAALTLCLAPVAVWSACVQNLLQGEGALGPLARIWALPPIVSFLCTVTLAVTGYLGVATYLAGNLISGVASAVVALRYTRGARSGCRPLAPLVRFGARAYAGHMTNLANGRLDQLLVVPLLGNAQLGLYAVAVSLASFPVGLAHAVAGRSLGEIAGHADRRAEAARFTRLTVALALVCCAGIAVAAPAGVPFLYGSQFRDSVVPILILLPGSACLMVLAVSTTALTALGRPGVASFAEVLALVITVVGLLLWLPTLGIVGAALTSTLSYAAALAVQMVALRRQGVAGTWPGLADVGWLAGRVTRGLKHGIPARAA